MIPSNRVERENRNKLKRGGRRGGKKLARLECLVSSLTINESLNSLEWLFVMGRKNRNEKRKEMEGTSNEDIEERSSCSIS